MITSDIHDAQFAIGYDDGYSWGYFGAPYDTRYEQTDSQYARGWRAGYEAASSLMPGADEYRRCGCSPHKASEECGT
jgi:hypothetical protein